MWKVDSKNNIIMTRGDTPVFVLNLTKADGDPYVPASGDEIVFVIKRSAEDEEILAQISIPTDTLELRFYDSTTRFLEFGKYVYEISLNNASENYHDTFIANTPIFITEELYNG